MRVTYDYHEFFRDVRMISDYERLHSLGLPIENNIGGIYWPRQVDELLEICANDAGFHIVTYFGRGIYLNRYEPRGDTFKLAEGIRDPDYMLDVRAERNWILADYERK